jgi:phage-related protein
MVDTLPSAPKPDPGAEIQTNLSLLEATLGDGYTQRAKNGINNVASTLPLTYTNITGAERDILINFCIAHSAGQAIYYQLADEGTPRKWYIKNYKRTKVAYDVFNVTINLQECFDI